MALVCLLMSALQEWSSDLQQQNAKRSIPVDVLYITENARQGIECFSTLSAIISSYQNMRTVSKCKVSHSYSLKYKMKRNETDVITATPDQRSKYKVPLALNCL